MKLLLIACIGWMALTSCKGEQRGEKPTVPSRVISEDSADATASIGTVNFEDKYKLVLGLPSQHDYQNDQPDGNAIVDGCINFLDENMEVGEAKCTSGKSKTKKLTAGMFKQTCFGADSISQKASQKLELDCAEAQLFIYSFDPPLRAELQQ